VRRLRLADAFLGAGQAPRAWPVADGDWYTDATPRKVAAAIVGRCMLTLSDPR